MNGRVSQGRAGSGRMPLLRIAAIVPFSSAPWGILSCSLSAMRVADRDAAASCSHLSAVSAPSRVGGTKPAVFFAFCLLKYIKC